MENLLKSVTEPSLGYYSRNYLEDVLAKYTSEARKQIRDLLMTTVYYITEVAKNYITLEEVDFDGNYVSSIDIYSDDVEF